MKNFALVVAVLVSASVVGQAHASHTPWHVVNRAPSYVEYPWTDAYTEVKHYGSREGLQYGSREEFALRTSPYKSVTHALHPYYRQNYFTPSYTGKRVTRPEFYSYLSDLYYNGAFDSAIADQKQRSAFAKCYNYSTLRLAQRTPEWMTSCK